MSDENQKIETESTLEDKFCINCGEKLVENQKFCMHCGAKVNAVAPQKRKININKKYVYLIAGIVILSGSIFGIISYNKSLAEKEDRKEYLTNIKDFEEQIETSGENLQYISDTIETYWYENIYDDKHGSSIDSAIMFALIETSDEINQAHLYNQSLLSSYKKIGIIPNEQEDLKELYNIAKNSYNSYTDFYEFAINPSGNYNEYSANNNDKTDKFYSDYRALNNIIVSKEEMSDIYLTSQGIKEEIDKITEIYKKVTDAIPDNISTDDNDLNNVKSIANKLNGLENIDVSILDRNKDRFKDDKLLYENITGLISIKESYDEVVKLIKLSSDNSDDTFKKLENELIIYKGNVSRHENRMINTEKDILNQ